MTTFHVKASLDPRDYVGGICRTVRITTIDGSTFDVFPSDKPSRIIVRAKECVRVLPDRANQIEIEIERSDA